MNAHREYFLQHLDIGEQWVLRKNDGELASSPSELLVALEPTQEVSGETSDGGIQSLRDAIADCRQCSLCATNGKFVLSEQIFNAEVLVIYDWSEQDNFDVQVGSDFKKLLVNILKSIAIEPGRIASMSFLHAQFPASNLSIPSATSAKYCGEFLRRAIKLGKAKSILVFGARAANALLETELDIDQLRTNQSKFAGVPMAITYSPYQLLKQASLKGVVWNDLCRFQIQLQS
jgi:uracil-DNA glycosylase family 4